MGKAGAPGKTPSPPSPPPPPRSQAKDRLWVALALQCTSVGYSVPPSAPHYPSDAEAWHGVEGVEPSSGPAPTARPLPGFAAEGRSRAGQAPALRPARDSDARRDQRQGLAAGPHGPCGPSRRPACAGMKHGGMKRRHETGRSPPGKLSSAVGAANTAIRAPSESTPPPGRASCRHSESPSPTAQPFNSPLRESAPAAQSP